MLLLIDNFDSFTYNLVAYCEELGADVAVYRNNAITPADVLRLAPSHIILSPGPCGPTETGVCLDLIPQAIQHNIPLLGVCLGHQAIGHALGGVVKRAPLPMHGKTSAIHHNGRGIFVGLPNPFSATRYHSLIVAHENLPANIQVTARTDDGLIMGLQHKTALLYGVQFHPESILTENGYQLLANFLAIGDSIAINPAIIAARNDYLSKLHQATNS